ncbi:MAG: DUF58 domain-containing protein [Verrucomicrobiales bacterium]|nr:DUF58 domain-containing protein [Verrucomicrobiales bacterium]
MAKSKIARPSRPLRERLFLRGRLTPAGSTLLAAILFTGIIAFDTESSLSYQTFAFLACLLLFALLGSLFFKDQFQIERSLPRFGTVGEPLRYTLDIHNQSSRVQSGLTLLETLKESILPIPSAGARPRRNLRSFRLAAPRRKTPPALVPETALPPLLPRDSAQVSLQLIPLRRGPIQFGTTRISRTDPFGLIRAFVALERPQRLLILPKRYPVPNLHLPGKEEYQPGGVTQASAVGQSEEFVSLRDYRRGDPLRHIHWRSWAKTGEPIVKEFEDEYFVRHGLILDTFDDHDDSDIFEEAVALAASFACNLRTQESLLDLMFVGVQAFCFSVGRGVGHNEQLLEILACAEPSEEKEFQQLHDLTMNHAGQLAACVCIFLKWDARRHELVRQLLSLSLPIQVFILSHTDRKRPIEPGPLAAHPECFHVLEVGRIAEGLARL